MKERGYRLARTCNTDTNTLPYHETHGSNSRRILVVPEQDGGLFKGHLETPPPVCEVLFCELLSFRELVVLNRVCMRPFRELCRPVPMGRVACQADRPASAVIVVGQAVIYAESAGATTGEARGQPWSHIQTLLVPGVPESRQEPVRRRAE